MRQLACIIILAAAFPAAAEPAPYKEVDYSKIPRALAREPEYVGNPRYAMFIFDGAGEFRVWAVLDKSAKDLDYEDVLYFDRNGDGDLTGKDERLTTKYRKEGEPAGIAVDFHIGDVVDPKTGEKHTDFRVSSFPKSGRHGVWFQMKWRGKVEMSGGYGLAGMDTTVWGGTPALAPILRPTPEGPFSFGTWGAASIELTAGGSTHLNVLVGHKGSGDASLSVVDENFLDLKADRLFVTVVAKDSEGREVKERSQILKHC
ncbi:MAG: hypothetical protein FD180_2949 [Planctomycetota bacterium]|nr:MAG: hypothetical protein FD180_2949 [Planctomycetota bacterium]